jgi:hypothetical protein
LEEGADEDPEEGAENFVEGSNEAAVEGTDEKAVEGTEEDAPNHDSRVEAERRADTGKLQVNVAGPGALLAERRRR